MGSDDPREPETLTPEQRVFLFGTGWDGYETILNVIGDRPNPRVTYHRGDLELMTPSHEHKMFGHRLDRIVILAAAELRMPIRAVGQTTWRQKSKDCGLEADASFYLAGLPLVRGKRKTIDLSVDPPPDLAVEMEIRPGTLDRMAIYSLLGVPEVWRFDGITLQVLQLQPDDSYAPSAKSCNLPALPMEEVVRWVHLGEELWDDTVGHKMFSQWVRDGFELKNINNDLTA